MCLTVSPTPAHSHSLLQYMLNTILCMFSVTWTVYVEMYLPVWVWLMVAPLHSLSTLWHVHCQPHQPVSMACSMECRHVAPVVDYWRERGKNEILHLHMLTWCCVYVHCGMWATIGVYEIGNIVAIPQSHYPRCCCCCWCCWCVTKVCLPTPLHRKYN